MRRPIRLHHVFAGYTNGKIKGSSYERLSNFGMRLVLIVQRQCGMLRRFAYEANIRLSYAGINA